MKIRPTQDLEKSLHRQGIEYVAGVDEAGRGPVAGPVTAAAVILPTDTMLEDICDSKILSPERRRRSAERIKKVAVAYSVVHIPNDTIDSINILNATRLAVERAVAMLGPAPRIVLIDGKYLNVRGRTCISIVKGDASVYSIAAASILAKTARDSLMLQYAGEFPEYFFERNKGYLTSQHLDAIRQHGYSPIHRRTFCIQPTEGSVE